MWCTRAQLLLGMHNPLRPGIKPVSSALTGGFSSTAPPGKSRDRMSFNFCLWSVVLNGGELSPRGHLAVTFEGGHVHGILGVEAEYAIRWKHLTENKTALNLDHKAYILMCVWSGSRGGVGCRVIPLWIIGEEAWLCFGRHGWWRWTWKWCWCWRWWRK